MNSDDFNQIKLEWIKDDLEGFTREKQFFTGMQLRHFSHKDVSELINSILEMIDEQERSLTHATHAIEQKSSSQTIKYTD